MNLYVVNIFYTWVRINSKIFCLLNQFLSFHAFRYRGCILSYTCHVASTIDHTSINNSIVLDGHVLSISKFYYWLRDRISDINYRSEHSIKLIKINLIFVYNIFILLTIYLLPFSPFFILYHSCCFCGFFELFFSFFRSFNSKLL